MTYGCTRIEAPNSNAIDSIKSDFMKKIAIICFAGLLPDEDHLLTDTFFTNVWFQDHNNETMIDHQ